MPDGMLTTNANHYIKAWRKAARPIEKLFGVKLAAFDPDFSFTKTEPVQDRLGNRSYRTQYVQLPAWFVEALGNKKNEG